MSSLVLKEKPFLATTAIEQFWDLSHPIIFLGDWCLRYSRKAAWEKLEYKIIHSPLEDKGRFYEAYQYADNLYERALPILGERLNGIHNTNHDLHYWRIVVGPWLMHYIYILYDRYLSLKSAIETYPNFVTIGLPEEDFITPRDTWDFIILSCNDPYNLQTYTRILHYLGRDYSLKKLKIESLPSTNPEKRSFLKTIFNFISNGVLRYYPFIIKHSYISSHLAEIELFIKSAGKIWFDYYLVHELPFIELNFKTRASLENIELIDSEFENLFVSLLSLDLPKCFVEGYVTVGDIVERSYPFKPKAIFCTEAWYADEVFKRWAAGCCEKGVDLYGIQYGADYGIAPHLPFLKHELSITKFFYSWGFEETGYTAKVKQMPATKFIGRKEIGVSNKKKDILLVTNVFPRYLYRFQDILNYDNAAYFSWQQRFAAALGLEWRRHLRVRLFGDGWGRDCEQRWRDSYPDVRLEQYWDAPFLKSLERCRIHVSDHLASTFLEGLVANKPTILFWDPKVFPVKAEVQPFFDELKDAGILYDSPEEAASAVCSAYPDVESWWNDFSRQSVRKRFCNLFAKTSPDAVSQWAAEFRRIAREGTAKENE